MVHTKRLIIFSDLDGSLLDHKSYSWRAADDALKKLRKHRIPLVLCSSKTCAEIQELCQKLGIVHPFIFENGCGVAIPEGYFSDDYSETVTPAYTVHYLGSKLETIHAILEKINDQSQYDYELFSQLPAERISIITGLSMGQAALATERHCSEPLLWHGDKATFEEFREQLNQHHMTLLRGGRFHTVTGMSDKGRAIKWLLDEYGKHSPESKFTSLGLGDSGNDVEMFHAVDHAILINNPHIEQPLLNDLGHLHKTTLVGPAGWNRSVLDFTANQLTENK